MNLRTCLSLSLAAVLSAGGLAAAQRVEQQVFAVQPGCTVRLDTYRGLINVVPGADHEVRVAVRLELTEAKSERAQALLAGFTLAAATEGNEVRLVARNPRDSGMRFTWEEDVRPQMIFTLIVPEYCHLDLQTKDGGITVGPMRGNLKARGDTGTIFCRYVDGSVDAATRTGDVVVSRCTGLVKLQSVQGNLRLGAVGGRADLATVNGDIEVQTAYAAVHAATASGNVTAGFAKIADNSQLKTSLGDVRAAVNPVEGFALEASASLGHVTSKLPLAAGKSGVGRSRLAGTYHGGGPLLNVKAGGGNVIIEGREPLFSL